VKYFCGAPVSTKLELAPYVECSGANHLDTYFQDIIDKGGEGVILRDPVSPNQPGRSNGYLKHKVGLPLPISLKHPNFPEIPRRGSKNSKTIG